MKNLKNIVERIAPQKPEDLISMPVSSMVRVSDPANCPFKDTPLTCAGCSRGNFHISVDGQRIRYEVLECYRKIVQRELFERSGMPAGALLHTFDKAVVDRYNKKLVSWLKDWELGECGAYIYGDYGVGKTYLLHCFANRLVSECKPVKFVREVDLYGEIKDTYNIEGEETEGDVLRIYANCPLLILDDVGKQRQNPWASQIFYHIIDGRVVSGKPTFLTSNYDLEQLEAKLGEYGEGIVSRLFELCEIRQLKGQDKRFMAAKREFKKLSK